MIFVGKLLLTFLIIINGAIIQPTTGQTQIKILAMGQVDPSYSPISDYLKFEPSLSGTLVVSRSIHAGVYSEDELRRFVRIYLPRTYKELLGYDFFVYDQPILTYYDNVQIQRMSRALHEEGVGAIGFTQSSNNEMYEPWMNSDLPKAFPHDQERFITGQVTSIEPYDLEVIDDPSLPPVISPFKNLGIEKVKPFGYTRALFKKDGVTEWARAKNLPSFSRLGFTSCPLLISWEFGERGSRVWATGDQFCSPMWGYWWGGDGKERYSLDIFINIVWYSCRRTLPGDPVMVHRLRSDFVEFKVRMGTLYALLDFVERFGANSRPIHNEIIKTNSLEIQAEQQYLAQDIESSLSSMQEVFDKIHAIEIKAVKAKKRALLWVYLIEWSVVTGTFGIIGFAVWTLMIRKRLYHEIQTTTWDGNPRN